MNLHSRDSERREQAKHIAREVMRQEFSISPLMAGTPIGRAVFDSIDKAVDAALDAYTAASGQQRPHESGS